MLHVHVHVVVQFPLIYYDVIFEKGLLSYGIRRFEIQVPPVTFEAVSLTRRRWQRDREVLLDTRFMTYANKNDTGLDMLLMSARWSNISIKVVGMGEDTGPRFNFAVKFVAYLREISDMLISGKWAEGDVIVLMDAFDVLVFPPLRNIKEVSYVNSELQPNKCLFVDI